MSNVVRWRRSQIEIFLFPPLDDAPNLVYLDDFVVKQFTTDPIEMLSIKNFILPFRQNLKSKIPKTITDVKAGISSCFPSSQVSIVRTETC